MRTARIVTTVRWATVVLASSLVAAVAAPAAWARPGDLDPTFSDDGYLAAGTLRNIEGAARATFTAVRATSSGQLVASAVVSYRCEIFGCFPKENTTIARFNPDGSLDPTFGNGGELDLSAIAQSDDWLDSHLSNFAVQPDGKIVLVGLDGRTGGIWVARLAADGTVDPSFGGGDGAVRYDLLGGAESGIDDLDTVEIDGDRIVVGGTSSSGGPDRAEFLVAVLRTDGSLDPTFSQDGWLTESRTVGHCEEGVYFMVDVLVAGSRTLAVGQCFGNQTDVFAYAPDGARDLGFAGAGLKILGLGSPTADADLDPQQRLILLNDDETDDRGKPQLVRLSADGSFDTTFGGDGTAPINLPQVRGTHDAAVTELALDAESRPVIAGGYGPTLVGRFTSTGALDRSFSEAGWSLAFQRQRGNLVTGVVVTPDGIVTAGGSTEGPALTRRTLDGGPLDTDGDGAINGDEECPYIFGPCPEIKRRIPALTFKRAAGVRGLHSRLVSDDNSCKWGWHVRLYRVAHGEDEKVAHVTTRFGGIHFEGPFSPGRYYAAASRRTLGYGACPAVRSPIWHQ